MEPHTTTPILFPKVQVPPTRPQLVSRQRLLQALDQGLHRRLTLISAPAGYGKSTLLSEWAGVCSWPLGWVTLESGDNDLERFLAYLFSAMQVAGAGTASLDEILGARISMQPLPLEAMLAILLNQLPMAVERMVLVLDDYHHIDSLEIHGFISELLEHLPPNIHLVIATRTDPPLPLARLRARDQLNEITESELRFSDQEASAFFNQGMGLQLTSEQVVELGARTEGWVTGLQLAGLSLKDRQQPADLIATLAGTHRYILDYLLEEVFSDLPADLQTFLLRTSILERLSPGLCDAVAGDPSGDPGASPGPDAILEHMDAANLFVVALDSQRQWYRYHPLFADFLRHRLETRHAGELPGLNHRAAGWFANHDMPQEAVAHSLAAGDTALAADLIQAQSRDLLRRGEITTLRRWIAALPEAEVETRPLLGLRRAWAVLMHNPASFYETVGQQVAQIALGFGIQPGDLLGTMSASEPGSARRAGLAEFAMLLAYIQRDTRDVHETIELFKAAFEYLPESEALLRGFTLAGLASTYARAGAIKKAEQTFARAARISLESGSTYGYVATTDWQATMQAELGQLRDAAETYRAAIARLSGQGHPPLPLSGHAYVGLAEVLFEWNDLADALQQVQTGLEIGEQVRDIDALLKGYVVQARLLQALGRSEEARESVLESERVARETKYPGCFQEAQAWTANLALTAGDIQAPSSWASGRGFTGGSTGQAAPPVHEVELFTYARLLMARGKAAEALPLLAELSTSQEQVGRIKALIESLVLQALCLRSTGRTDQAEQVLGRALLLAEPEGYSRVFIQGGPAMAALLRSAAARGHTPEYARRLLEGFAEVPEEVGGVVDPLSERELEVLRLVADGLTNAEISAELVIAHSTIKTHINRIYSKLAVRTRTQAVARARQLRIIP
jgi:LuxR family maltose regulon positive regulatory protein